MKTPNFFILGAQKSGTTYLAAALADHPEVFFSDPKETMFFWRKMENTLTEKDYADYCEEYFSAAKDEKWRGEGSTTYLQWLGVRDRLSQFVTGKPKFIVCLRQPTSKAISFYIHNWRRDRYPPGTSLSDAAKMEFQMSPFETSLYAPGIEHWLGKYPRSDFLFLRFDDLQEGGEVFLKKATDFLGIEPCENPPPTKVNAGLPLVWEGDSLTVDAAAAKGRPRPKFSLRELEQLHYQFIPDLSRTEELTAGLDLSDWYKMPALGSQND